MSELDRIITYENIMVISPYEIKTLKELKIEKRANNHSLVYISGIVPEGKKDSYIEKATIKDNIKIVDVNGENETKTLFSGLVTSISIKCCMDVYYIAIEGISHTYELDIKLKKRSFQNPGLSYIDLLNSVIKDYPKADFIDNATKNSATGKFILQYEETDWSFVKRLASHFDAAVIVDDISDSPKFRIGLPPDGKEETLTELHYDIHRDISSFMEASENYCASLGENDFTSFEVESTDFYNPGTKVDFKGRKLVVGENVSILKDGILRSQYVLMPESGIRQNLILNQSIIGASIEGKIIDTQKDTVRIHLEIDDGQKKDEAYWFPYSSFYTAEGNSGWYCMPQHGDSVKLYFPNDREEAAMASSSIRKGGGSCQKTSNPDMKYLGTSFGKEMLMAGKELQFTAKECTEGIIQIKLHEDEGVKISSINPINFVTDKDLKLDLKKKLSITAEDELYLISGSEHGAVSSLFFNGDTDLKGSIIKVEGTKKGPINVDDRIKKLDEVNKQINAQKKQQAKDWLNLGLDMLQFGLDIAGMIPGIGIVANVASAAISVGRAVGDALSGDWQGAGWKLFDAGMSAVACIPLVGPAAKAGKIAKNAKKAVNIVKDVGKAASLVSKSAKVAKVVEGTKVIAKAGISILKNKKVVTSALMAFSIFGSYKGIEQMKSGIDGILKDGFTERNAFNVLAGLFYAGRGLYFANSLRKSVCWGDPINVVNGSFYLDATDLSIRDRGMGIGVKRQYNSVVNRTGIMGTGWTFEFETQIIKDSDEQVSLLYKDGHTEEFIKNNGAWHKKNSLSREEILSEDGGIFTVTFKDNTKHIYNSQGKLEKVCDRYGNTTMVVYGEDGCISKIETPGKKTVNFEHFNGKVVKISDNIGREVRYRYDNDKLISVTLPNGGVISYTYENHFITSVADLNGTKYVQNDYDSEGRVTRQVVNDQNTVEIVYDDENMKNTFTCITTGVVKQSVYNSLGLLTGIIYGDGTSEAYTYDEYGNRNSETDRNGRTVRRLYDSCANLLQEINPDGSIVWNEYDEKNNLIRKYTNGGSEEIFVYDENGNLIKERVKIEDGIYSETTYSYDCYGRIKIRNDPENNAAFYEYERDDIDNPTVVTDPSGNSYRYGYDDAGRMTSITTDYGTAQFTHNELDKRTLIKDAKGNTTYMEYDRMGNLVGKVMPNNYNPDIRSCKGYKYQYDAMDRLIRTIDPMQNVFAVKYDTEGNLTKEINPNYFDPLQDDGTGVEYVYDHDGRRIKAIYPTGGTARTKYDSVGNIVKTIDPVRYNSKADDGPGTEYTYDEMNRLVMIKDPDGNVAKRFIYDLDGRLVKEIEAKGYKSAAKDDKRYGILYRYNAVGWLIEKRVPNDEQSGKIMYNVTLYTYDRAGRRIEEKRSPEYVNETCYPKRWNIITYDYDKNGRITRISDSTGARIDYEYDCLSNRTLERVKISDTVSRVTRYRYSSIGLLEKKIEEIDGDDLKVKLKGKTLSQTLYEYDKNGNLTKVITPEGYRTVFNYDDSDRLIKVIKSSGNNEERKTAFEYDKAGNVIKETDCNGNSARFEYDSMNRRVKITDREDGVTRLYYDAVGNVIKHIPPQNYDPVKDNGHGTIFVYDSLNRVKEVYDALGNNIENNKYNAAGELIEKADSLGSGIKYIYDIGGRVKQIFTKEAKKKGNASQEYTYDALGNITGIRDGEGNYTQYVLDLWGRATEITKADESIEKYGYDYAGNITSSTDGNGNTTEYTYNSLNLLAGIKDPAGGLIKYRYDLQGRLAQEKDRNGNTIEYLYNMDDNIVHRREASSGATELYTYNLDGSLMSAVSGFTTYNYLYTPNRKLKSKTMNGKPLVEYRHDKNGNVVELKDLTGRLTQYQYDMLGRLEEVWDSGQKAASYMYNPDNTIAGIKYGNGIDVLYTHDVDKNITGILAKNSKEEEILRHVYAYDNNGNQIERDEDGRRTRYEYDRQNRLSRAFYHDEEESFGYDRAGNRIARSFNGIATKYSYDNRNRLLEKLEGNELTAYRYDSQGNLLTEKSSKGIINYTYDCFNRTASVEKWDGYIKNRYDPEGLRYEVNENGKFSRFVYDGRNVIAELDRQDKVQSAVTRGHELLAQKDREGNRCIYLNNAHGDVTALVDMQGNVVNSYRYDAFGNTLEAVEKVRNRFKYAGEQFDGLTGQYYLRARFYNPVVGRFTQEDVYRGDGLNLYAYVGNNPIKYVDPSGYAKSCKPSDPYAGDGDFERQGRFTTPDGAAKAALIRYNQKSIRDNLEYGGLIYKTKNGRYDFTKATRGDVDGVSPWDGKVIPKGSEEVGYWHTHGNYSKMENDKLVPTMNKAEDWYDSDNFSPQDINVANKMISGKSEYQGYVGTPSGIFKGYNVLNETEYIMK